MDVVTSERDPDLDLVTAGDIKVTFRGGRQVVEPTGQASTESQTKRGRHEALEEDV